MRARYPDREGFVEREGARLRFEVYENDAPTLFLAQTWNIVHSRHWKFQIPYLSRHYRVVAYDPVGNGGSDRPTDPDRYSQTELWADAMAVMDATHTERAMAIGLSMGGGVVIALGALHPDRFAGIVAIGAAHPWAIPLPSRASIGDRMFTPVARPEGWDKYNVHYWRSDWTDFVEFFFGEAMSDPHSTKPWDDLVSWAHDTTGHNVALGIEADPSLDLEKLEAAVREMPLPVLLIHGTDDRVISFESSRILAEMIPDAQLVTLEGAGHIPSARYPVKINHLIKAHADRVFARGAPPSSWHIGHGRPRRVLVISSPVGLGHAQRDVALVDELRAIHPDVQVEWLAQHPVTQVLEAKGETIHPASRCLANESAHIESQAGEHDLAVFQALREMDEILASNFMLIDETVGDRRYDLVIGDEAWETDYHLHENPGLKKAPYVWLTDFVGYLPMPERGEREAFVAADYNAEMIEQIARYGWIRDQAIFVGEPADIVPDRFGPDLPLIREWTVENYGFSGYITGFDPAKLGDRAELRQSLGYGEDERVCIVSVGGSGVGTDLIRKIVEAFPEVRKRLPELRMIVVTGPRIDPGSMPPVDGVEYHGYVDRLYRHLAVADLAIVQGGLTTTMELTACKVPFLYVPLRNHFEQNFHVRARLARYNAGRHLPYEQIDPDYLAAQVEGEMGRAVEYGDVETDGAARAARLIGELL